MLQSRAAQEQKGMSINFSATELCHWAGALNITGLKSPWGQPATKKAMMNVHKITSRKGLILQA